MANVRLNDGKNGRGFTEEYILTGKEKQLFSKGALTAGNPLKSNPGSKKMAEETGQRGGRPMDNPDELLKKIASLSRRGMTQKQIARELGFTPRIRDRRITQKQVLQDRRVMDRRKSMSPGAVIPREVTMSDLRNILMVGIHLAKVDKDFHWEEARILNKINDIIQLTSEEKQELLHEGFNVMEGLDALVTAKARKLLVKFLCAIAHSDQVLQGSEVEFINKVNAQFGNLVTMKPLDAWHEYEEEVADILQEEFA